MRQLKVDGEGRYVAPRSEIIEKEEKCRYLTSKTPWPLFAVSSNLNPSSQAKDAQIPGVLVHNEWRGTFEEFEEAVEFGELDLFLNIDPERAKREAAAGLAACSPVTEKAKADGQSIGASTSLTDKPSHEATKLDEVMRIEIRKNEAQRSTSTHQPLLGAPRLAGPIAPSAGQAGPSIPLAPAGSGGRSEIDADRFLATLGIEDLDLTEDEISEILEAGKENQSSGTATEIGTAADPSAEVSQKSQRYPGTLGLGNTSGAPNVPRTYIPSAEAGTKPLRLAKMGPGDRRASPIASPRQRTESSQDGSRASPVHARYNTASTSSKALAAEAQASVTSRAFSSQRLREAVSRGEDLKAAMSTTRITSGTDSKEVVVGREDLDSLMASLGLGSDIKMTEEEAEAFLLDGIVPQGMDAGGNRLMRAGSVAEKARNEAAARDLARRAKEKGHGSQRQSRSSVASLSVTEESSAEKGEGVQQLHATTGEDSIIVKNGDEDDMKDEGGMDGRTEKETKQLLEPTSREAKALREAGRPPEGSSESSASTNAREELSNVEADVRQADEHIRGKNRGKSPSEEEEEAIGQKIGTYEAESNTNEKNPKKQEAEGRVEERKAEELAAKSADGDVSEAAEDGNLGSKLEILEIEREKKEAKDVTQKEEATPRAELASLLGIHESDTTPHLSISTSSSSESPAMPTPLDIEAAVATTPVAEMTIAEQEKLGTQDDAYSSSTSISSSSSQPQSPDNTQQPRDPTFVTSSPQTSSKFGHQTSSGDHTLADRRRRAIDVPRKEASTTSPQSLLAMGKNGADQGIDSSSLMSPSSSSDRIPQSPPIKSPNKKKFSIISKPFSSQRNKEKGAPSSASPSAAAGRSEKTLSMILREADEAMKGLDGGDDDDDDIDISRLLHGSDDGDDFTVNEFALEGDDEAVEGVKSDLARR